MRQLEAVLRVRGVECQQRLLVADRPVVEPLVLGSGTDQPG